MEVRLGSMIEPEWLLELFPDRVEDVDRRAFDTQDVSGRAHDRPALRDAHARRDDRARAARRRDRTPARRRGARPRAGATAGRRSACRRCCSGWRSCGGRCPRRRFRRWTRAAWRSWCARPAWAAAASPSSAIPRRWCCRRCRPTRSARWRPPRPNGSRSRADAACRSTTTSATRPGSNRACRTSSARARCRGSDAGRVALTVHLLAPNGRAVQVTRDLENFWAQHYPALRRQLSRRYPKTRLARGRRHRQAASASSPAPPEEMNTAPAHYTDQHAPARSPTRSA